MDQVPFRIIIPGKLTWNLINSDSYPQSPNFRVIWRWVRLLHSCFSVVTQRSSPQTRWGGAWRDDSKNGCVADYLAFCIQRSAKYPCRIEAAPPDRDISITGLHGQTHNNLLEANNIERMCMVIYHEFDKTVKMHINSHKSVHFVVQFWSFVSILFHVGFGYGNVW